MASYWAMSWKAKFQWIGRETCRGWQKYFVFWLFWITCNLQCQKHLWTVGFSVTSIKIWRPGGPLRKQKFTSTGSKSCGLWLVDFNPFCIVCQEDLCYDVLLCDVNFLLKHSRFRFPRWNWCYRASIQRKHRCGRKQIGTFPLTFNFAASARYCRLYFTSKD